MSEKAIVVHIATVRGGAGGSHRPLINPRYSIGDLSVTVKKYGTESKNLDHA